MFIMKKVIFGFLLGFTGHVLGIKIINSWKTTPDSWVLIFRYAIGMCLVIPMYSVLKYGFRGGNDVEDDIKNNIMAWILVGSGVMGGYIYDQYKLIKEK